MWLLLEFGLRFICSPSRARFVFLLAKAQSLNKVQIFKRVSAGREIILAAVSIYLAPLLVHSLEVETLQLVSKQLTK